MAFTGTPMAPGGYTTQAVSSGAYGDVTPLKQIQIAQNMLSRPQPYMLVEMFGRSETLQANTGDTIVISTMVPLAPVTAELTEGVTPASRKLTRRDVKLPLTDLGDVVEFSDRLEDLGDKRVISQGEAVCGECAGESVELLKIGRLGAGTSVYFANGSVRTAVNTGPTKTKFQAIERYFMRNKVKPITRFVPPALEYGSESCPASYIAWVHPDLKPVLEALDGFTKAKDYATPSKWENDIGTLGSIRFLTSTLMAPYADAGGDKGTMISTTGVKADVYPIYIFGEEAYAHAAFKGAHAITPSIIPAEKKDKSDPLGQRGYIGWKTRSGACIVDDTRFVRYEVACSEL